MSVGVYKSFTLCIVWWKSRSCKCFLCRNRKALESRSLADDERLQFLETQLKEAKYISEDADRKYDEVSLIASGHWLR